MEILRQKLPQAILEKGLATYPEDSSEIAWPIALANEVVGKVNEAGLAILGGDIYERNGQRFKPAYEHWHSEIWPGEKWEDFVLRSYVEAKAYLKSYWLKEEQWFVLVVVEKPDASMLAKSYAR
ncbi:MAG: Imm40 family immunity protein [Pseudomonadales bacterium]|nr:Imm40 family immunity protein [Pseudomonadales bacterium]